MGEKHSKAARFSTSETLGERGVVKDTTELAQTRLEEEKLKKKEPKVKVVGGEEVVETVREEYRKQPSPKKKTPKPTKYKDEEISKPVITEEERTRRKETIRHENELMEEVREKEYRESVSKATLKERYGDYGELVQKRVNGIVDQVHESRSDFEDIMESYMNKLTNTKLLLDEIQKEDVGVGDVRQLKNNLEVCVIRSNFFIANVIQSILSQRETLVFQTPDPFFKVIPMYLWRKFEKHYDNLLLIQKSYPNSESSFRKLLRETEYVEGYKTRRPKYEISKYDTLTEEFNQLVNYLDTVTGVSSVAADDTMERKYDRLIRLFSELENDSRKNYSHMKAAINRLKDDIRELTNIHEQAENAYPEMPAGFKDLSLATRRGEKKRVELKRCSNELKTVCDTLMEIRRDLSNLSTSMNAMDIKERGDMPEGRNMNEKRLLDTTSRIQSIFWHLYVVKHLFIPELFSMDTDEMSFKKVKDIIKRMNFTNLFKNTYSAMDAKTVLLKYVFEVLLETNDMLDRHVEESFAIEKRDMREEGERYVSGRQYMRKESKSMHRTIDDSITKTQSNVNHMNMLMSELEETFRSI